MAIPIVFTSNTAELIRGTERVGKSLEQLGDELEGIANEFDSAGASGTDMTRDLGDGADTAARALGDLGDKADTAGRAVSDGAERGSDALGDLGDKADTAGRAVGDGADTAARALGDLGDKADSAGRDIAEGLEDGGKGAEKFEDQVRDAMRKAAKHAKDSGGDIGKSQKDGFKEAGEGLGEFKDEANSTARESAASFDGSAESIIDSFQEIAANAFAGFGPAGAVAGLAIAAGIGIAITKMQELAENNNEVQQGVADLAQEYMDLGGRIDGLDIGAKIREWGLEVNEDNWLTFWADEAETNFTKYKRLAEEAGVSTTDAFQAMKGSYEDAQAFMAATEQTQKDLTAAVMEGTVTTMDGVPIYTKSAQAAKTKQEALEELRRKTVENLKAQEEATEITEIDAEVTKDNTDAVLARVEALDELSDTLSDSVTADLDYREQVEASTAAIKKNGESTDKNTKAGRDNWRELIKLKDAALDRAAADLEAGESAETVAKRTREARDAFLKAADAAGLSDDAARDLARAWGLVPEEISTKVEADTKKAHKEIDAIDRRNPQVGVEVYPSNASSVQSYINRMNGQSIYVTVKERAGGNYRV